MKVTKIDPSGMALNFLFSLLLLTTSCSQLSNSNTDTQSNSSKEVVETPKMNIQTAIMSNNLEIVKQHIEAGTDINEKDAMTGATPLILAVTFGKTAIAKALIEAKADLTIKNNDGATALHAAAFFCRLEILQMLIDAKADKTAKNNFGATPRESVMGPFAEIKPIYEMIKLQLEPLGLKLDLTQIEKRRPVVAMMLQ